MFIVLDIYIGMMIGYIIDCGLISGVLSAALFVRLLLKDKIAPIFSGIIFGIIFVCLCVVSGGIYSLFGFEFPQPLFLWSALTIICGVTVLFHIDGSFYDFSVKNNSEHL